MSPHTAALETSGPPPATAQARCVHGPHSYRPISIRPIEPSSPCWLCRPRLRKACTAMAYMVIAQLATANIAMARLKCRS